MKNNKRVLQIIMLVIVIAIIVYIVYKIKDIIKSQQQAPIFVKHVRNAKKGLHISGEDIPIASSGNEYTFMSWLNISDWDYIFLYNFVNFTYCF